MLDAVFDWIKRILYFSLFITVFLQLLPGESYKKYVRFFAGILLIILAVNPVLKAFSENDLTEDMLRQMAEQEEKTDMELDITELEAAQQQYYRKQADTAVRSVVEEKADQVGAKVQECTVEWSGEGEQILSLSVCILSDEQDEDGSSSENGEQSLVERTVIERIRIQADAGEKDEKDDEAPSEAARQLKTELLQTFELSDSQVRVWEG